MNVSNKILSDITVYMKYAKYGTTLHEERTTKMKDLLKYLNDVQEELMDAVLYLQTAKEDIIDKKSDYTYPDFVDKFYNEKKI